MSRRNFNVYRDGKVHVCAKMCETCIYRRDSPLFDVPIKAEAFANETAVICHSTLGGRGKAKRNAVCAGFYRKQPTITLIVAQHLGVIELVPPP